MIYGDITTTCSERLKSAWIQPGESSHFEAQKNKKALKSTEGIKSIRWAMDYMKWSSFWAGTKHGWNHKKSSKNCDLFTPLLSSYCWFVIDTWSGWWFGTFFVFPNSWDDDPIWLIFFRGLKPPTSDGWIHIKPLESSTTPYSYLFSLRLALPWQVVSNVEPEGLGEVEDSVGQSAKMWGMVKLSYQLSPLDIKTKTI